LIGLGKAVVDAWLEKFRVDENEADSIVDQIMQDLT